MEDMQEVSYEKKISQMFTVARVIAILTVVSAHITIRASSLLADFYNTIGSIGVIVFLIISGYYYKKEPPMILIHKKVKSLIVPWITLGSLVWLVNSFLNDSGYSISSLLLWLVGYKTYLYYILVLIFCFLIFYFNNTASLILAIVLNSVSITLTCLGVMQPIITTLHITDYLNVFNWIGFFAIGVLLKRIQPRVLYQFIESTRYIFFTLSVLATLAITFTGYTVGYFSAWGWLYEMICAFSIFGVCTHGKLYNKVTSAISNMSYAIYLLHMMFTGVLAKVYGLHPALSLFANIIVLGFTFGILFVGRFVSEKVHLAKVYTFLTGIRQRR